MTVLVIRRLPGKQDREYPYRVLVDGRQRAELVDDSTVQIGLTPGAHRVGLNVKWCGSREIEFTIQRGEIVRMGLLRWIGAPMSGPCWRCCTLRSGENATLPSKR